MNAAWKEIKTQEREFRIAAKEILNLIPKKTGNILDVGSGIGWVVDEANKRGYRGTGIDINSEYVTAGKKFLRVDLRTISLEKFQTGERFDVVILKHVLEHIAEPKLFLGKVKKLMKPGGFLIVSCPNIDSLMSRIFLDRWYGLQPQQHRWQFTKKSLPKVIKENGFTIEKVVVSNLWYDPPSWRGFIFALLLKIADLTNTGDLITIVAKKK